MTTEVWQPMSAREAGLAPLREGVPPIMERPLRDWVRRVALRHGGCIERARIRVDLFWTDPEEGSRQGWDRLADDTPTSMLLDVTDALLHLIPRPDGQNPLLDNFRTSELRGFERDLQQLLDDARSVYTIARGARGLERRVSSIMIASVERAATVAQDTRKVGSAAAQIRSALDALKTLQPNPETAYGEAVKAVESAAHAVVEPTNRRATLGTMLRMMRDFPDKYAVVIPGPDGDGSVAPVIEMMKLLWEGQTSRHGSKMPTRPETPEEAEMAVTLAATLVEWFTTGKVRRR